jgi:hypothetical protein
MNGGTAAQSNEGALGVARNAEWESTAQGTKAPTAAFTGQGVQVAAGSTAPTYGPGGVITNLKSVQFQANNTPTLVQSYLSTQLGSAFDEYYTISRTFAKLRELRLTYNITNLGKKSVFKTASVALIGRNLLYFAARKDFDIDQYASGFDVQSQATTGTSSDVTLSSPTARWFGFNLNFGF